MTFNQEECERLARVLGELAPRGATPGLRTAFASASEQLRAACELAEKLTNKTIERNACAAEMDRRSAECARLAAENEAKEHLIGVLRGDIGVLAAENEALRKERDDLRADRKQFGEVLSKTNEALNRAGCFSALYYWEHIDAIAAERNSLRAEVEKCHAIIGRDAETIEGLRSFVNDCAKNWDCDEDSHKYGTTCRACEAEKLLDAALQPDGGERE